MTASIRKPHAGDREQWATLYRDYAHRYPVTDEVLATVWSWILDTGHEVEALVADDGGRLVGFAHFRAFARPTSATYGGYLDDVFVTPQARGGGIAEALLSRVAAIGAERGWTVLRWITAETNYRARAKYDKVAVRSDAVTYDLAPGSLAAATQSSTVSAYIV